MASKQLSKKQIFTLCLGDGSRGLLYGIITTYLLTFFIPTSSSTTLPLFVAYAGVTLAIIRCVGTVVDAVTDPWIASISDRWQGKHGRRIPFMRVSALPYAVCCLLIFYPPFAQPSIANGIWVGVFLCLYYLFQTMYNIPFFALGVELVTEPRRRVFLYTISSLMFVIGSVLVFFTSTFKGMLMAAGFAEVWALRIPFIGFCALGLILALIPAFLIHEDEFDIQKGASTYNVPLLKSLKATFSYRNFTILTIGYLVMWVAFAFFNATLVYYVENLLALPSMWVTIVSGISVVVGICTYPLLNLLARKVQKKSLLLFACACYVFIYTCIYFYAPIVSAIGDTTFAILLGLLIAFPIATTNIIPSSMFADMAQYDTIKTGNNRSAMFVAARNFIEKLSQAIILLIIPLVLTLNSLDGAATSEGIQLTALIAAVTIALALFVYTRYDEKEISQTLAADAQERAVAISDEAQEPVTPLEKGE